jgi:hypothetical protein
MFSLVPDADVTRPGPKQGDAVHLALLSRDHKGPELTARHMDILARIWYRNAAGMHTEEARGVLVRAGAGHLLRPYIQLTRERGVKWAHAMPSGFGLGLYALYSD